MTKRFEVRLAGTGGQGVILAGIILSDAAAIGAGKKVAQTQSYGPEARGGASKAEVIISEDVIDYPKVVRADLLLAMSQEACDRYGHDVKAEGWLIIDAEKVKRTPPHPRIVRVPISQIAEEETGRGITANMVALGVIVGLTEVVERRAIKEAIERRAPAGTKEMNLLAVAAGLRIADQLRG